MTLAVDGPHGAKADINMTPLIDVLLVLIVIFMIITPLTPVGLDAMIPQPPPSDLPPAVRLEDLIITVRAGGAVFMNQEHARREELAGRLAAVYRLRPNQIVFIRGEAGLEFREVASVIDTVRGAGLLRIALMTTSAAG